MTCGKMGDSLAYHSYSSNTDATCNGCDYVRELPGKKHTHQWQYAWTHDGTHHWHKCSNCTETKDYTVHSYTWKTNTGSHWKECICGHKIGKGYHVYDDESDTSCNTCGYIRYIYIPDPVVPPHIHSWSPDWTSDATHHWHQCVSDDAVEPDSEAEHTYPSGSCDYKFDGTHHWTACTICGHEQPDSRKEHEPYKNADGAPQWEYRDDTSHHLKCYFCGCEMSTAPHDTDGTDGSCSACGYTSSQPPTT